MTRWRISALVAVLVICVAAASIALAAHGSRRSQHPTAAAQVHAKATHVQQQKAGRGAASGDDESAGENESGPGDASTDGVEQGPNADHQCPPDCAPGEAP